MENFLAMASSIVSSKFPISSVTGRYRTLRIVRYFLALSLYSLFFFLRILSRFLTQLSTVYHNKSDSQNTISAVDGDCAISRALSQMLLVMNSLPVSSRKYELVCSMAEREMDRNVREGISEVNRTALSSALSRTMIQLADAMSARRSEASRWLLGFGDSYVNRAVGAVRKAWAMGGSGAGDGFKGGIGDDGSVSAEKLAAELLWMARKMVDCGAAEEAVRVWGSASGLASMARRTEPRLQGSLVRVSVFLFKQAKEMGDGGGEEDEESVGATEQGSGMMNMLISWLPLLCHSSSGTDAPTLSSSERVEIENILDEMIEKLSNNGQEKVLALWLHHFAANPNSDWPNLQACYSRWYAATRKLFLLK